MRLSQGRFSSAFILAQANRESRPHGQRDQHPFVARRRRKTCLSRSSVELAEEIIASNDSTRFGKRSMGAGDV